MDKLIKCLRFNHCEVHNLLSAIRKSASIQCSVVMNDSFEREMKARMALKRQPFSSVNAYTFSNQPIAQEPEEQHFCGEARKYYNEEAKNHGRAKLLKGDIDVSLTLFEEFSHWAFQSKIQELDDQQRRLNPYHLTNQQQSESAQVRNLTYQLQEEKRKVT